MHAPGGGVTRFEITAIESPAFGGQSFGDIGPYEKLTGRVFGEVDPDDPRNQPITDLRLAPRNEQGMVDYDTGVMVLRPVDPQRGNGGLFYEPTNRGVILSLSVFNDNRRGPTVDPTADDAGNGFLMRRGYHILFSGWDPTAMAPGPFSSHYPIATKPDGSPIVGPSIEEFVHDDSTMTRGRLTYPAAGLDTADATFTVRTHYDDDQTPIAPTEWRFVDEWSIELLPSGTTFEAGRIYELLYPATRPTVAGLALAAVRDIGAFARHADADSTGAPNPLAGRVRYAIAQGTSQPARLLHDFVGLGFNLDVDNGPVFDGVLNWIGGASGGFFNYRFAQPSRTHRQHVGRWTPERIFPFANQVLLDAVTQGVAGRLERCAVSGTCPKIFEANSSNEYWVKGASLLHTDTRGSDLLIDPPNVRYYHFAGRPHSPGPPDPGICQQPRNPLGGGMGLRALLVDLDDWIVHGKLPPRSEIPRRVEATLAPPLPQSEFGFPDIPGVTYTGLMTTGDRFDFGPRLTDGILDFHTDPADPSVIASPVVSSPYPVLVPRTDEDGNEMGGIRFPDVAVPVATYTGYALRAAGFGGDDLADAFGQAIAFPATREEREATGDPRLSIEERYPTHDAYVQAVTEAARQLEKRRFLLAEDVERIIRRADRSAIGR